MNLLVNNLTGKIVKKAQHFEDYFQLFFVNAEILNLYNKCVLSPDDVETYSGLKVLHVAMDSADLVITFSSEHKIMMSLRDDDYVGPEAISFQSGAISITF